MFRFLLKRLALTVPTFVGADVRHLHDDPTGARAIPSKCAAASAASRPSATPSSCTRWVSTSRSGSSSPTTSGGLLHGDFGVSIITKTPVLHEFLTLFPATLELSFCAMIFAIVIGVPAGVIAAGAARRRL